MWKNERRVWKAKIMGIDVLMCVCVWREKEVKTPMLWIRKYHLQMIRPSDVLILVLGLLILVFEVKIYFWITVPSAPNFPWVFLTVNNAKFKWGSTSWHASRITHLWYRGRCPLATTFNFLPSSNTRVSRIFSYLPILFEFSFRLLNPKGLESPFSLTTECYILPLSY